MAKPDLVSIDTICNTIQGYYPDANVSVVRKAFEFADRAHGEQKRSSGDPYIIHPTEVARILADLRLDLSSICAAFLHDTVEDTSVRLEDVEREFGKDVATLVDGVTKLNKMSFRTTEEKQAENFRKMIIAMSKDIRVIIVKLADRLSNMRSLQFLPGHKQKTISQETLDIYAPLANRLGMSRIKVELEDLCLRFIHPDVYYKLAELVAKNKTDREKYIEDVTHLIHEKLTEYDVKAQVSGRAKHFYSIYKKMERRQVDFNELHDIIAFRIVVENITECYKALGVIHAAFRPVPGRFKDYIAMPKANNYQSLHTTVIGPSGERTEIQIRTHEMHLVAERGIAAHWKYKEGKFETANRDSVDWVNRLLEWQKDLSDPNEFLETVKVDLFSEDVFVFTPKGEVKELPYGATPLDFAYAVHTDVGNRCVGAKVNGRIVSLRHRLKSGDAIEVITSPTQTPSKDWLKIVKSSRAKAKIRAFIKMRERETARLEGLDILEKTAKKYEMSWSRIEKSGKLDEAMKELGLRTMDELYVGVGYGRFSTDQLIQKIIPKEDLENYKAKLKSEEEESFLKRAMRSASKKSEARNAVVVEGVDDVLVRYAKCCNPVPGESIVGFITRGRGVTIHQAGCTRALDTDTERRIDVHWNKNLSAPVKRAVRIRVFSNDDTGLLAVMSQTITGCGVNISSANIRTTKDKKAIAVFEVEVGNMEQLNRVMSALESKKGVISVERS
ncbi:MAG: bifunctional (p)ppGpp synthetase/guanosine-3',5'-bis(diphosphate) 3'-pyrophosphohydrolase [Proteobacteria bacterium]|nr:bifunctional (p)ppGpp synthetase/guanosine-3',5'-bis(diphosphate) 3'-pyrophosphohydrolase [Pseudomonadota bacterium]